jgi:hypothetical protein
MMEESSRVDVGRTVADDDSEGEGEEKAEVEDMICVRGIVSCETGRAVRNQETSYFCKEDDGCVGQRSVGHAISRRGTFSAHRPHQIWPNNQNSCCGHVAQDQSLLGSKSIIGFRYA